MIPPEISNKLTIALNGIQSAAGLSESQLNRTGISESQLNGIGFFDVASFFWNYYKYFGLVSAPICMYHGYKRNNGSKFWTIIWGAAGAGLPIIAPIYALKQGYAEPTQ